MTAQSLVAEAKQDIREIDVESAACRLEDGETVVLDVREPTEFEAGCLGDAINIPRGVLEFRIGTVPSLADPGVPILVYCRSGGRAALAAQTLQRMGYSNVVSLAGGFEAWRASGRA
jgi:rhodanese-related sulfurtransferase